MVYYCRWFIENNMAPCTHIIWTVLGLTLSYCLVVIAATSHDDNSLVDAISEDSDPGAETLEKRHIGRWKNANWVRENRNIGRWKNRDWEMSRVRRMYDGESDDGLTKRSSPESYLEPEAVDSLEDSYPYMAMYDDLPGYDDGIDKRWNSRWALVHRKLNELNRNSNTDKRDMDADKRHASRWKLIHRKLQQIHNARKGA